MQKILQLLLNEIEKISNFQLITFIFCDNSIYLLLIQMIHFYRAIVYTNDKRVINKNGRPYIIA